MNKISIGIYREIIMNLDDKIDEIEARVKSEAIIVEHSAHDHTLHEESVKHVTIDGLWLEFGVYRGNTIAKICELTDKIVYGFDCFTGLPETWDADNPRGMFNMGGIPPNTTPDGDTWGNVEFVVGLFQHTLTQFLKEHSDNIAYLHIDSDLYSAASYVLEALKSRIVPGTIIVFDELLDFDTYREHEIKAFAEFIIEADCDYEVIARMPDTQPFPSGPVMRGYSPATFKVVKK